MSIISSLFKRRTVTPDAYAWIGLDFGTATTECVVRIEASGEEDRVAVMAFGGSSRSDAEVILPSAIQLYNDVVHPAYMLRGGGHIVEIIKTNLIAEIDRSVDPKELRRPDGPFAYAILHLASILHKTRFAIDKWFGGDRLRMYLNIAAPVGAELSISRNAQIRAVFHEIGYRALVLSSDWPSSPPTTDTARALVDIGLKVEVPSSEQSPVFPIPEALAAVTAFLHAPDRGAGNYATIDVGGGTTDISYFWFQTGHHSASREKKAWYYTIRTAPVGMNDLIARLKSRSVSPDARTAHEQLRDLQEPRGYIDDTDLDRFLSRVDSSYRDAFREAFTTRPVHSDWCMGGRARWTTLLLGGGSGCPFVREHLSNNPPKRMNIDRHGHVEMLVAPSHLDILLPTGKILTATDPRAWHGKRDVVRQNGHLLTVAYGLAFRAPDIPKYGVEESIEPPPPPKPWEPPPHMVHN